MLLLQSSFNHMIFNDIRIEEFIELTLSMSKIECDSLIHPYHKMGFAWVLVGICKGTSIKASLLTYTQKLEKNKGKSKLFFRFL